MQHLKQWGLVFIILCTILIAPAIAWSQGAVATKAGNKYRIITKRPCSLYVGADDSSERSPCGVFQYWYVLPPQKGSTNPHSTDNSNNLKINDFYRVASGDAEKEFRGYIKNGDAELWIHQQVVKLAPKQGRKLVSFYSTTDDAVNALKSGNILQGEAYREPSSPGQDLILMPVLKAKEATVKDEKVTCFKTAFMAAPISTLEQNPAEQTTAKASLPILDGELLTKEHARKIASVDIVFTVDTTASMKPLIEQVKRSIAEVAKKLAGNKTLRSRIRYGLVAYRDTVGIPNALDYTAKIFCNLEVGADHKYFINCLSKLEDANTSSVDYPEDVFAGLMVAMDMDRLKWNPVGWKQIVIVGDSSIKGPDHPKSKSKKNQDNISMAQILAKVQPGSGTLNESLKSNFVVSVVYAQDPAWRDDHLIGKKQYNELISGRKYNGDLIIARGGHSPEDFSGKLIEKLLAGFKNFDDLFIHGQSPKSPQPGVSAARYPYPVLDLINRLGEGTASGLSFANSFATEYDAEGNRVLIPHLWVRKGDLKSFNALLEYLQGLLEDAGEPGSKNVQQVLQGLQIMSTTLNLSEPITPEMPLDRFLSLLGGFPLKNPIFRISIHDIAAMSQTDYEDWVKKIKTCMETLGELAENSNIWFKLHPQANEREEHAFINMTDLP